MRGANKQHQRIIHGFSLLEVMVALALLALSFTSLILVQARATRMAYQSRNISIATQLARMQLSECKRQVQKDIAAASDFKLDGNYTELGHPNFTFECHAPKFNMKAPSTSGLEQGIKKNAKEAAKKDVGTTASVSAPFISMVTDSLGNSVRELVVIIRWTDNNVEDEIRVVTHVIDLTAMAGLSRMLSQGAKAFGGALPGKAKEEAKAPPGTPPNPPRQIPRGPG
jgi:prepilin-type N-terminal cleavage/methylation domain-containing protein